MRSIPILYEDDIARLLSQREAAHAIRDALLAGLDPASDRPRSNLPMRAGQLLLMPSESATAVGVKAVTVAPGNTALGLPRVHGAYLIYNADTLELTGILDGAVLSILRTPAVSMAGIAPAFGRFSRPVSVTVFGAGPQGVAHAESLRDGGFCTVGDVAYVVRRVAPARESLGPDATILDVADTDAVLARVRASDVIVTTTTARSPLFPSSAVADHAVIAVVGAHESTWREVDGELLGRSTVVVEDRETAMREAGDVVFAAREGHLTAEDLVPMADVIRGKVAVDPGRPYVFKSVGMSWEDLVVAEAVMARVALERAG